MSSSQIQAYRHLIDAGLLNDEQLKAAAAEACLRTVDIETVLMSEYGMAREDLLAALSDGYGLPAIEYDERLPVPPELLINADPGQLAKDLIFPVILAGETVVLAVNNPEAVDAEQLGKYTGGKNFMLRVALASDIRWFIEDYLNDRPGSIIGTERTGLAFWRNTMAAWRTRLACYRNELAKARVSLGILRWGLGFVTLASASIVLDWSFVSGLLLYWTLLIAGIVITSVGIYYYLKVRRSLMRSPKPQTLIEVTAATVCFLENYHLNSAPRGKLKETMLSRLGDFLPSYCSVLRPVPESRERTHLARERNVLASQRTMAACYRAIYARARTGLAFIRTGIVFIGIGAGLIQYFQLAPQSVWGLLLGSAGILMVVDGLLWYLPARKEEPDLSRQVTEPILNP